MTRNEEIEAREKAAIHRHRFEQKYERSIPSCTVKIWECPCGAWSIRHFGCHNGSHDQNSLATTNALLAQLKDRDEKLEAVEVALQEHGYSHAREFLGVVFEIMHPKEAE